MTHRYQVGDILLHSFYEQPDYYLVEQVLYLEAPKEPPCSKYVLRDLRLQYLSEYSTVNVDTLETMERVA